jgi:hypothetical protein
VQATTRLQQQQQQQQGRMGPVQPATLQERLGMIIKQAQLQQQKLLRERALKEQHSGGIMHHDSGTQRHSSHGDRRHMGPADAVEAESRAGDTGTCSDTSHTATDTEEDGDDEGTSRHTRSSRRQGQHRPSPWRGVVNMLSVRRRATAPDAPASAFTNPLSDIGEAEAGMSSGGGAGGRDTASRPSDVRDPEPGDDQQQQQQQQPRRGARKGVRWDASVVSTKQDAGTLAAAARAVAGTDGGAGAGSGPRGLGLGFMQVAGALGVLRVWRGLAAREASLDARAQQPPGLGGVASHAARSHTGDHDRDPDEHANRGDLGSDLASYGMVSRFNSMAPTEAAGMAARTASETTHRGELQVVNAALH